MFQRGEWTQNPAYWEKKWKRKWESDGHLNVTYHNYAAERTVKIVTIEVSFTLNIDDDLCYQDSNT